MYWCRTNCEILLAESPVIKFIILMCLEEGVGIAKLSVGVTGNYVTVNITVVSTSDIWAGDTDTAGKEMPIPVFTMTIR